MSALFFDFTENIETKVAHVSQDQVVFFDLFEEIGADGFILSGSEVKAVGDDRGAE